MHKKLGFIFIALFIFIFSGCSSSGIAVPSSQLSYSKLTLGKESSSQLSVFSSLFFDCYPIKPKAYKNNDGDIFIALYREREIAPRYEGIWVKKENDHYLIDTEKVVTIDYRWMHKLPVKSKTSGEGLMTFFEVLIGDKLPFIYISWQPTHTMTTDDGYAFIQKGNLVLSVLDKKSTPSQVEQFIRLAKHVIDYPMLAKIQSIFHMSNLDSHLQTALSKKQLWKFRKEKYKEQYSKNLAKIEKMLHLSCDYMKWYGNIDDEGYPQGEGTLSCTDTIGHYGLIFDRYLYVTIQTSMNKLSMQPGDVTVRISGGTYQNTIHFNTPADIRRLVREANAYYETYVDRKNSRGSSSVSACDAIYHTCTSYCGGKSANSPGFSLSGSDKEECKNKCFLGKLNCEHGDTLMWKVNTCNGICRGYSQKRSALPFSTSSFDKCVEGCKKEIFKGASNN